MDGVIRQFPTSFLLAYCKCPDGYFYGHKCIVSGGVKGTPSQWRQEWVHEPAYYRGSEYVRDDWRSHYTYTSGTAVAPSYMWVDCGGCGGTGRGKEQQSERPQCDDCDAQHDKDNWFCSFLAAGVSGACCTLLARATVKCGWLKAVTAGGLAAYGTFRLLRYCK
jgi:hypothetical protein